jgi:uncharacterized circularly permuted ATP-grasp superfamily protein
MAAEQTQRQAQSQTQSQGPPTTRPSDRNATVQSGILSGYDPGDFFDEMFLKDGTPRPECQALAERLAELPVDELMRRQRAADRMMIQLGITFNVYGEAEGTERAIPFDTVPRIMPGDEWDGIEKGLRQRISVLNKFIDDIYHDQRIIKDGIIPEHVIKSAATFRPQCKGLNPPGGIWCHITGTDLIRDADGEMYVLEDNLRCPSGVSYVLQNRMLMKQTFPHLFESMDVEPVDDYPGRLLDALTESIRSAGNRPSVAVLTPGIYNSAYFEHSFLAQQMGVPLVEGRDLFVEGGVLFKRTTRGPERMDVLYRRIDDDFIDPKAFRADSMLGVPGLMEAYRRGNVVLANAPGTGVADDKVIYSYVPDMIRFYLSEEPILPNVPTYLCWEDDQRKYVLDNLDILVVKAANEAGGYGMLIGPGSTKQQQDDFADRIKANPRNYIAQPTISLSRTPVICGSKLEGRHVDLRPFILSSPNSTFVLPGGLSRVALKPGSLVVNSSQGGGSKDTWVVRSGSV